MSWLDISRKDFADSTRGNVFLGLTVGTMIIAFLAMYWPRLFDPDPTVQDGIQNLYDTLLFLIPIIALAASYRSIAGERESGSLRIILSLPLDRMQVFLGKLVGRSVVVLIPVAIGFACAAPLIYLAYGSLDVLMFFEAALGIFLISILYVSIAIGISASVSTARRALALVIATYLTVYLALYLIPWGLHYVLYGDVPQTETTWMEFIETIPPHEAIDRALPLVMEMELSSDMPILLQEWVAASIVLLWILTPLLIGYFRFTRTDIT